MLHPPQQSPPSRVCSASKGGTAALHAHPAALSVVSFDSSDNRTGEAPVTQGERERSTQSPASARRKPPPPHRGPIDSGKQETTQGIRKCTDVGVPREAAPPSHMRRAAPHAGSRAVMRQASAQGASPGPRAPPPPHQEAADPGQ
jgi:hypothetical protein